MSLKLNRLRSLVKAFECEFNLCNQISDISIQPPLSIPLSAMKECNVQHTLYNVHSV